MTQAATHVAAATVEEPPPLKIDIVGIGPEKSGEIRAGVGYVPDRSIEGSPRFIAAVSKDGNMITTIEWEVNPEPSSEEPSREVVATIKNLGGGACEIDLSSPSPVRMRVPGGVNVLCACCKQKYTTERSFIVDHPLRLKITDVPLIPARAAP
jgi:hypothetical protein